jgi:multiple sugar transport system permease protein
MGANDRKSLKGRILIAGIYFTLILGGLTMVYPFMIMVTGSTNTSFDVERRSALPRWVWSREDRFMRMISDYFPASHRKTMVQARAFFNDLPESWQLWVQVGDDIAASDAWARRQIAAADDEAGRTHRQAAAGDYLEFAGTVEMSETVLSGSLQNGIPFLREKYGTLAAFNAAWQMHLDDFTKIRLTGWDSEPLDMSMYLAPRTDQRYLDLQAFKEACRKGRYHPHLGGADAPAIHIRPAALAWTWETFAAGKRGDSPGPQADILPFPVPDDADPDLRALWSTYLENTFPMRHIAVKVTPERSAAFQAFLETRFRNVEYLNRLMSSRASDWTPIQAWTDAAFTATAQESLLGNVWMDFVRLQIPQADWIIRNSLPEKAFQEFALAKYASLDGINKAYGLKLNRIEQLRIPFQAAILETFHNKEWSITLRQIGSNYAMVFDYLFRRGRAVSNTVVLVVLTILIALTVNPIAGYALSRFQLPQTQKIIVFCLATTAFPAAVAAIPGFLLLRDLGLLNTFAALVLPAAANGMTIFLLKGFFDSLPKELYEAATIDGANEMQVFFKVSLPLVKPILAVGVLNAFILAYNGWAWAILVCQDPKMWTLAVWTYQFYQTQGANPAAVMAAFLVNSLPVFLVFISCQKIILRGIILPTMK